MELPEQHGCSLLQIPKQGTVPSHSELISWLILEAASIPEPTGESPLMTLGGYGWDLAGGQKLESKRGSKEELAPLLNQENGREEAKKMKRKGT